MAKTLTETERAERAAKFEELANKRVNALIKQSQLVGNLGASQYVKTDSQVDRIESAATAAIAEMVARLRNTKSARQTFSL